MSVLDQDALQTDPALEFDSLTNPTQLSYDPDVGIRAGGSFRFLGSGASAYGQKNISSQIYTSRLYFKIDALPTGTAALVQSNGVSHTFAFQIAATGHPIIKIGTSTDTPAGLSRTDTGFTFAADTWYRLDLRWNASGTTWTFDYQISDGLTDTLLYTATQLTLSGLTAETFTAWRLGQNGSVSLSGHAEDRQINGDSTSYPIGVWTPIPTSSPTPIPSNWMPPVGKGVLLGLRSDWSTNVPITIATRESQLGRSVPIAHTFRSWNDATRTLSDEQSLVASGHIPMISWPNAGGVPITGGSTGTGAIKGIAAGDYDANIITFAQNMQALASPVVLLRLSWEMNGSTNPWRDSPTDYIAMFRHVFGIMQTYAPKVKLIWCPQRRATNTNGYLWAAYDPGVTFKHYNGLDAYSNSQPDYEGDLIMNGDYPASDGRSRNWYTTYAADGLPMIICETGCREQIDPTQPVGVTQSFTKAAWYTNFKAAVRNFPLIFAWVAFDKAASGDWRVDTDPTVAGNYTLTGATFVAFKDLAHDAYWNWAPTTTTPVPTKPPKKKRPHAPGTYTDKI